MRPRIAELDGLRGVAVLLVIASHYALTRLSPLLGMGWAGVDLFFVLSGFLITRILRQARDAPAYYRPFWTRRARRIWPLAYAAIAAYYITAVLRAPALAADRSWLVFVFFLQAMFNLRGNARFPRWFAHFAGVAWSLSVEEWFYIVWAPAVRRLNRTPLLWLCAGVIAVEPLVRVLIHRPDFPEAFLFVSRADALAWGAVTALLLERPTTTDAVARLAWPSVACAAAACLTLAWATHLNDRSGLVFSVAGYSVLDASAALLLAALVARQDDAWMIGRTLRNRWLGRAGVVSYGMYLLHMPAFDLTRWALGTDAVSTRVVAFVITAVAASLSWRYFEAPILGVAPGRPRTAAVRSAAA